MGRKLSRGAVLARVTAECTAQRTEFAGLALSASIQPVLFSVLALLAALTARLGFVVMIVRTRSAWLAVAFNCRPDFELVAAGGAVFARRLPYIVLVFACTPVGSISWLLQVRSKTEG